ncbi:MAG: carbon monoxide dehydrogenase subunit G [Bradymonadia bacterium]|jgi:carbon monoxide dehydrogenase subunit G
MARFSGEVRESFVVAVSPEEAIAHFGDLETIARNYIGLQSHELVDDETIRFLLEKQSDKGVTYQGRYTCRYIVPRDGRLEWSTVESTNMWSTGHASFRAEGGGTRVEYFQKIETEMPVPRLLAKLVGPIVKRKIADGVRDYIQAMRRDV